MNSRGLTDERSPSSDSQTSRKPWYMRRLPIVGIITGLILVIFGGVVVKASIDVPNRQIALEQGLSTSYLDNQAAYNRFTNTVLDQYNLASDKAAKMTEIIKASVVGGSQFGTQGALVNALSQSFPDLAGLNIYDKLAETIASGRVAFEAAQKDLFDRVRSYLTWREQWPNSWFVNPLSDTDLVADDFTGAAAIHQMRTPVISQATRDAFRTHTDGPLIPKPTPTHS